MVAELDKRDDLGDSEKNHCTHQGSLAEALLVTIDARRR